jgi:hypothetical protein
MNLLLRDKTPSHLIEARHCEGAAGLRGQACCAPACPGVYRKNLLAFRSKIGDRYAA